VKVIDYVLMHKQGAHSPGQYIMKNYRLMFLLFNNREQLTPHINQVMQFLAHYLSVNTTIDNMLKTLNCMTSWLRLGDIEPQLIMELDSKYNLLERLFTAIFKEELTDSKPANFLEIVINFF
jgi:hypothetical protein